MMIIQNQTNHNFYTDDYVLKSGELVLDEPVQKKIINITIKIFTHGMNVEGITSFRSRGMVFKINDLPGYIIKRDPHGERAKAMCAARKICLQHHLTRLCIPKIATINVTTPHTMETLLIEEELHFAKEESVQERKFQTLGKALEKPIRQFGAFICLSEYADVEYRNNPLLDSDDGKIRIGLIDLEPSVVGDGISGKTRGSGSRGLLNCVSDQLVSCIVDEVKKYRNETLSEDTIAEIRSLWNFYRSCNIHTGRELVTTERIDFSTYPASPEDRIRLSECATLMIHEINMQIQKAPEELSIKNKRRIKLDILNSSLCDYDVYMNGSLRYLDIVFQELCTQRIVHSIQSTRCDYIFTFQV